MDINRENLIETLELSYKDFLAAKNKIPENKLELSYIKGQYEFIEFLLMNHFELSMDEIKLIRKKVFEGKVKLNKTINDLDALSLDIPTFIRQRNIKSH
jgi:hypothetical protein